MKRFLNFLFLKKEATKLIQPELVDPAAGSFYEKSVTTILELEMKEAIQNEDFEIYYQPQVNTKGVLQGVEALLRWNHRERGLISPGEFIPLAEENLLINDISDWVIKKVCEQIVDWKRKGMTLLPIAINISPIRLMEPGLIKLVKNLLELHDVPAKLLEFEITETSLLKNDKNVLSTISALKELGITIAIDDFGTGYSSLEYLREIHADKIKIDQVFINNLHNDNKKDAAIVTSIMHLAKGLNMQIVAEGVEEFEQLEFLKQKECDIIQGYLFSKPVPLHELEKIMRIGHLKPLKHQKVYNSEKDRRDFYRFEFPFDVLGKMTIIEFNKKKVNLGSTPILIKDVSLGGIKILSNLKVPINSEFKLKFTFTLGDIRFETKGSLRWLNEVDDDNYLYGVQFVLNPKVEDCLAQLINKMSVSQNISKEIAGTEFVYEDSKTFFRRNIG